MMINFSHSSVSRAFGRTSAGSITLPALMMSVADVEAAIGEPFTGDAAQCDALIAALMQAGAASWLDVGDEVDVAGDHVLVIERP